MQHTKHTKLARPELGLYGRNEWALVGAPCSHIQQLAQVVISALSDRWQCAYLDTDHAESDASGALAAGAVFEYTNQIQHHQIRLKGDLKPPRFRALLQEADLILANGNHHEAAAQVVIIDPAKENSLRKRLAQLTNVRLILLADGANDVFDFVENTLPHPAAVPRLRLNDTAGIIGFFEQEMLRKTPPLNGLVLAGGRSLRMGQDKGGIAWHGKPQREHMADLLRPFCTEVFISCRAGQETDLATTCPVLPDSFAELGPYGAILSAFRHNPNGAWLVVACDLPLLDASTLDFLVKNRQPWRTATSFQSPHDQMPEPLITIWEPKSYGMMLALLAQGYSCPRKVLLNSDALSLTVPNPAALTNVNTPEELKAIEDADWKTQS